MSEAAVAVAPNELVLGRYRPLQPLGSGGSGSVWLARDEPTGIEVALKIVPREGKAASRAEREASAAARLRHRGCQRAYALARDARHVYIAYEYTPGRTLREALRAGEIDDAAALESAAQICEALAHAHKHRIVHRDVKPSNVLLADNEDGISIKLLDFGLARMDGEETLTAAGDVPGTLAYIAPERLRGRESGAPADVWAVGVLLWEALAGWHPFWKGSLLDTARRIESGAMSLGRARPDLPKPLIALVDRALAVDPARRPSAARLAVALRATHHRRERERRRRVPQVSLPPVERFAPAAAAGIYAGAGAAALPFFPTGWPLGLAALAAAATLLNERLGLALALAVPVLPLGNVSSGLAWVYAAVALAWLALTWRDARAGLFFVTGAVLAPWSLLGLVPIAAQAVRGRARRAAQAFVATMFAVIAAGFRGRPLPFAGIELPPLPVAGAHDPFGVAGALWHVLTAHPVIVFEGIVLAAAAAVLPLATRRSIALFGALLLAGLTLPDPAVSDAGIVASVAAACLGLAARAER